MNLNSSFIKSAIRTIELEKNAIQALIDRIGDEFENACKVILACSGRTVVVGIGKSGHIARKIAATLASTGTPAMYVHAGEANHGDIGMITKNDVVLAVSNSGQTEEILTLLPLLKRKNIPIICLTGDSQSELGMASTVNLNTHVKEEACPLGLAPTASTTATLVMGDALAISLMEQRDFKAEDFRVLHPGGNLGLQMITVQQLMRHKSELAIVKNDFTMSYIVSCMTDNGFGIAVLVDEKGELSGVITDGDLRRNFKNLLSFSPTDIATLTPVTVKPSDLVSVALQKMEKHKIYAVIVTKNEKPVGLLRMHDILRSGIK